MEFNYLFRAQLNSFDFSELRCGAYSLDANCTRTSICSQRHNTTGKFCQKKAPLEKIVGRVCYVVGLAPFVEKSFYRPTPVYLNIQCM
jgi:hypothetical protein